MQILVGLPFARVFFGVALLIMGGCSREQPVATEQPSTSVGEIATDSPISTAETTVSESSGLITGRPLPIWAEQEFLPSGFWVSCPELSVGKSISECLADEDLRELGQAVSKAVENSRASEDDFRSSCFSNDDYASYSFLNSLMKEVGVDPFLERIYSIGDLKLCILKSENEMLLWSHIVLHRSDDSWKHNPSAIGQPQLTMISTLENGLHRADPNVYKTRVLPADVISISANDSTNDVKNFVSLHCRPACLPDDGSGCDPDLLAFHKDLCEALHAGDFQAFLSKCSPLLAERLAPDRDIEKSTMLKKYFEVAFDLKFVISNEGVYHFFVRQTWKQQTQSLPSIHSVRKKDDGTFELIGIDTHDILFSVLQSSQVSPRFQAAIGAKW